uniref:Lysosome-associated membrane glycoprotein 5 n=1 Tax=Culicoides sonorensis TaxID=179676 RepID=A0A336N2E7_CULSO
MQAEFRYSRDADKVPITKDETEKLVTTIQPSTDTPTESPNTTTTTTTMRPTTPPTTTVAPTTTTETPSTTTAKPSPVPKPDTGSWFYSDPKTNQTCVIVQMAIQLKFSFTTKDNLIQNMTHNIPVNSSTVVSGTCNNETQMIKVQTTGPCDFSLTFTKENETFELSKMEFNINGSALNAIDSLITIVYSNKTFVTPISRSYYCTKEQTITANETAPSSNSTPAQIILSHVQLEAFHAKATRDFSAAKDCESMETPDIVPIAVGIALAALVVVVLIAYLVARRRSQARGYMSM